MPRPKRSIDRRLVLKLSEPQRRTIRISTERLPDERTEHAYGYSTRRRDRITTADVTGQIEVYVDMGKLLALVSDALQSTGHRVQRGPLEIRAVNVAEVQGTRQVTDR